MDKNQEKGRCPHCGKDGLTFPKIDPADVGEDGKLRAKSVLGSCEICEGIVKFDCDNTGGCCPVPYKS